MEKKETFLNKILKKIKGEEFRIGDIVIAPNGSVCKVIIVRNDRLGGACVKLKTVKDDRRLSDFKWYRLKDLKHCDGKITKDVILDVGDTVVDKNGFRGIITRTKLESDSYYVSYEVIDNEKVAIDRWVPKNELSHLINEVILITSMQKEVAKEAENKTNIIEKKQIDQTEQSESQMYFEDFATKRTAPTEVLPEGWQWIHYGDGSGHLESPDAESYFGYDLTTCYAAQNGIEHKNRKGKWEIYWGDFNGFKKYAEETIAKELNISPNNISAESQKNKGIQNKDDEER